MKPCARTTFYVCTLHLGIHSAHPYTMHPSAATSRELMGPRLQVGQPAELHRPPPPPPHPTPTHPNTPPPFQLMGLDFKTANLLSDTLGSSALRFLPPGLRKAALETTFTVGRAASAPMRVWFAPQLREIFSSGATLRLQYPKEDLGFVYAGPGAAVQQVGAASGWVWSSLV